MHAVFGTVKNFFSNTFRRGQNPGNQITKKNLPFLVGLIASIAWLDCYALPVGSVDEMRHLSEIPPISIFPYLYPVSAIVIISLFDVRKLLPYAKYSAVITMIGVLIEIILGSSPVSYVGIILASVGFGYIFATTGYGFFMILNNSEKLYSLSIGILISKLILILKVYSIGSYAGAALFKAMHFFQLVPIIICTYFYRDTYNESYELGEKPPLKDYTILFLAYVVLLLNDFVALALWRSLTTVPSVTMNNYYSIGVFAGIIVIVFLQKAVHCNICYIFNVSLAILTLGLVINELGNPSRELLLLSCLLFGASYALGYTSLFYMMGVIAKKSRSLTFLRIVLLTIASSFLFGIVIDKILKDVTSQNLFPVTALISITVLLAVFAMTPFFTKILYSAEWTDDLHRLDVTHTSRLTARLAELGLSPRETEVCILLLDAYTMRQISAMLNIAYSTVNTYYTSIYRKLGINSRTELIVMFKEYLSK